MKKEQQSHINCITSKLGSLSEKRITFIRKIVDAFCCQHTFHRNVESDIISPCVLEYIGTSLLIHHSLSKESFSKDKFEYVLELGLNNCGIPAELAKKGNPGHDITINNVPCSLKTQADKSIKPDSIHISKFMELGKGEWGSDISHLHALRNRFFEHMNAYQRIFTLRALSKAPKNWHYELVEIPKALLLEAADGKFEMPESKQSGSKPGYCNVFDINGNVRFRLYFDGGSERKLQIKDIDKQLCKVHASWEFPPLI